VNDVTIFCGLGAAEAHNEIVQLAGKLKAPVAYSYKAKMAIQYKNPYEVGLTGLLGIPSAYHSMHESEVLLLLGTDFPYTPLSLMLASKDEEENTRMTRMTVSQN